MTLQPAPWRTGTTGSLAGDSVGTTTSLDFGATGDPEVTNVVVAEDRHARVQVGADGALALEHFREPCCFQLRAHPGEVGGEAAFVAEGFVSGEKAACGFVRASDAIASMAAVSRFMVESPCLCEFDGGVATLDLEEKIRH